MSKGVVAFPPSASFPCGRVGSTKLVWTKAWPWLQPVPRPLKPCAPIFGGGFMRVAMIGAGYVGLVSGACFADFGHAVVCVDKDPGRIAALQAGEIPIFEPGLPDLVANN